MLGYYNQCRSFLRIDSNSIQSTLSTKPLAISLLWFAIPCPCKRLLSASASAFATILILDASASNSATVFLYQQH
jgi:hypothetical protein